MSRLIELHTIHHALEIVIDLLFKYTDSKCSDYSNSDFSWWKHQGENHYNIKVICNFANKERLAKELASFDALDDEHRLLSELLLQRKITEKDDKLKVAIEVENMLWEHGRIRIAKEENESRASG